MRRVAHNARFANNDAKCFQTSLPQLFLDFFLAIARRFVYARRKVKTDRFYSFSFFLFSLKKAKKICVFTFSNLKRR